MQQEERGVSLQEKITLKHDRSIDYTNFRSYSDTAAINKNETISHFINSLREPKITEDKGSAGGFVGGFVEDSRLNVNVKTRSLLTIDIDDFDTESIDVWGNVEKSDITAVMYTSHNSKLDKPRYRLIIPLVVDIDVSEYEAVMRYVIDMLDLPYDPTSLELGRLMYYPTCEDIEQYEFYYQDKSLFDARRIHKEDLQQFKEISNFTKGDFKKRDPREKENWIGAWCNTYSITDVLETHLADVYKPYRANRYTYADGSTEGGLVVYDDNHHAHSHHSTDPVSGLNVNSFDLVRLHKFGELDSKSKPKTPVNKLPSYNAMVDMCMADEAVKDYFIQYVRTSPADDFADETVNSLIKELEINDRGAVVPNSRNAETILSHEPFKKVLAYDTFRNSEVIKGDLPWREREQPQKDYEQWLGSDDKQMLHYLGTRFDFKPAAFIDNAFQAVIRRNTFHPVKAYLEAQSWDGVPRVETFFIDYLGAEDSPYIRAVTRKWIAAAVTRIYEPGCKFDYMPVLVGPQGVGKSSLIAALGRDWFSDSLKNLDSKEAGEHLQASWLFEFAELSAMRRNEVEEIKAFITKQTDSYRVAYDRVVSDFPRKCVFIGTTNNSDFLRDQTGNRRFWAISTDPAKRIYELQDLTDEVVGQIWAEAMTLYRKGEKLYLEPELEAVAKEIQDFHTEEDTRTGVIEEYLEMLLPANWNEMDEGERRLFVRESKSKSLTGSVKGEFKRERVCAAEIWSECLGNDYMNIKPHEARDICSIIRKIGGWEERKPFRSSFSIYGQQRTFHRISAK